MGHTHFDCDALASRIAVIMKYRNVTSIEELIRLLAQCNYPAPGVEVVEAVMDIKGLFNPSGCKTFPVASSRVRRCHGCCTKVVGSLRQQQFMNKTSPLHWHAGKDLHGKVVLRSKLTCDDAQWSEQHYPWTTQAPRPGNRNYKEGYSGLRPSDISMATERNSSNTVGRTCH